MPEHTGGKWRVGYKDGSGTEEGAMSITAHRSSGDNECVVASGVSSGADEGCHYGVERTADALLIVAAPGLLDACKYLAAQIDRPGFWDEIIAKAEGGGE